MTTTINKQTTKTDERAPWWLGAATCSIFKKIMKTEMIDRLYLELSQVSKATTKKELDLIKKINQLKKNLEDAHNITNADLISSESMVERLGAERDELRAERDELRAEVEGLTQRNEDAVYLLNKARKALR